jgi:hypothetical protein
VGDWNGDGCDTVGLYAPAQSEFFLRNSNASGGADVSFSFGPGGGGWTPIAGDWNGDGQDTIGLYDPTRSEFFLRNSNTSGYANLAFLYGPANAGWTPIAGDWSGSSGSQTVGSCEWAAEPAEPVTNVADPLVTWAATGFEATIAPPLAPVGSAIGGLPQSDSANAETRWSDARHGLFDGGAMADSTPAPLSDEFSAHAVACERMDLGSNDLFESLDGQLDDLLGDHGNGLRLSHGDAAAQDAALGSCSALSSSTRERTAAEDPLTYGSLELHAVDGVFNLAAVD